MGGFIVLPRSAGDSAEQVEARFARSIDVFRHKGLALDRRFVGNDFIAYRFHKMFGPRDGAIEFDNGDFALCTGCFFYDDKTGPEALRGCYRALVEDRLAEDKIAGNFHLLICKNGELWSLGDYCGYYPVYVHEATGAVSSSHLALARMEPGRKINRQAFYEYVLHGFFANDETLFDGIRILDSRKRWRLTPSRAGHPRQPAYTPLPGNRGRAEVVEAISGTLNEYFGMLTRLFPQDIGSALSGGYDTRHMLALLRRAGATPYLYVYGDASSSDVAVARQIAQGENLSLDHIDKGQSPKVGIEAFKEGVERNTFFFDGIKPLGVIDDGSDLRTRIARAQHASLQLNGAGGEIYREIWNIGDRGVNITEFLRMRFDRGHYDFLRSGFDATRHFATLSDKVRGILGIRGDTLTRPEVEMLFPFLRNKFAQSNNSANSQISHSLLPFMETRFVFPSFDVPIRYKYCGELHAALIRTANPALARYRSDYGIDFLKPTPPRYRLRRAIERQVPLWLRVLARKRRTSSVQPRPYHLAAPYLESIVDLKSMAISAFVDIDKIPDPEILSRVLSVEVLLKHL